MKRKREVTKRRIKNYEIETKKSNGRK